MISNVKHISRREFNRINFYPVTDQPNKQTHVYTSIYGNDEYESRPPRINKPLWYDGVQLCFDDVDNDELGPIKLYKITKSQAMSIVEFIKRIHALENSFTLIVHCYAGVSRSAAISKFVNDILDMKIDMYDNLYFYNEAVYRELTLAWNHGCS
jgi:predicted protein tyrosine phosphatase